MRVCLIATELKGFGAHGGFGVLTHDLARGLCARGVEVYIVMQRKEGQRPIDRLNGITIVSYPSSLYVGLRYFRRFAAIYEMIDADIYHSEEPSLGTALAQIAYPHRQHLVTFQDPRNYHDWTVELKHQKLTRLTLIKFWIKYRLDTGRAARRASGKFCQARYIIPKTRKMYRLAEDPAFLPNPVRVVESPLPKAAEPTICYVGRWDERKRPELFLDLAAKFPEIKFVAAGACLNNAARDQELRRRCRELPNVEAPGWVNEEQRAALLSRSWAMVNTSTRECLPVTYLEAGVHRCAILSHGNADEFASKFGFWARTGDLEDFAAGLRFLIRGDEWRSRGEQAHQYVKSVHEYDLVIAQHIDIYEKALAG
jgi:glycosyltransferase involved in cell wall biosynthesis